jgi:sugar O-acyltransferase (sialic acid O-acetyltransferase NeuD family)
MNRKLLIIGASGHGKVVADIAKKISKWDSIAFLDDDENKTQAMNIKVIGKISDVYKYIDDYDIFVGIGNNYTRERIQEHLEKLGANIPILIHPEAILSEDVEVKQGTVIMAGAIINCSTRIGKGCIINTGVTIDHDNIIEDYVHISPGANLAGTVIVGAKTWIGIGSVVSNNVNITSNCIIGAGALVIKDIKEAGTYVGVPVRKLTK